MTKEEIRAIAIDSANSYYNYLEQNSKGVQEVDVFEVSYLESRDLLIKLRLSAKLFDTEAIFLKNYKNGKKYDTTEVKVIEYDSDKNMLLIKPSETILSEFTNLNSSDLKVVSDLKFLIQRVKTWYELNGSEIALPIIKSNLSEKFKEISYFKEKEFQPSENQKESIRSIFQEPFSYVWGAPGTGKTQFVLAYAVLQYINNGNKIAILAPTNNSIEQVLRGIIKMTDKAGIDRKRILRLGTPSRKFAEEFPEACEEKGIQKKLDEIDKQISILERIVAYSQAMSQLISAEQGLILFSSIPKLITESNNFKEIYENQNRNQKKKEIDIKYATDEMSILLKTKATETQKLYSFGNKLKKIFSSGPTATETLLNKLEIQIRDKFKEIELLNYEFSEIQKLTFQKQILVNKSTSAIRNKFDIIKESFSNYPKYAQILKEIEENNWVNKKSELYDEISREKALRDIDNHLFADYKHIPIQQVQDELSKYLALRVKLSITSTEERLKTVDVIACTLDGYIGRYSETKLNVKHIFLDEAGYANVIKALTLFNHSSPITFLGDHMQLPPVCEINDSEIQKDESFRNMFLWAQSAIHLDTLFPRDRDYCLNKYLNNSPFNPTTIKKTSLNSTFRFGNNLAKILARHVYQGDFNSSNPLGETQILFVDSPKTESLKSRISASEVKAIGSITESLKKQNRLDYVILTPYKKQVKLLNNYLPQERNELKILTVHGSQGREWETVILSVVDTNDKWFVDSTIPISKGLNLVNTAVSRAKRQLIIVCDKSYWLKQNGQLITDLLNSGTEIKN